MQGQLRYSIHAPVLKPLELLMSLLAGLWETLPHRGSLDCLNYMKLALSWGC